MYGLWNFQVDHLDETKNMSDKEIRGYQCNIEILNSAEQGINYPKEIVRNIIID